MVNNRIGSIYVRPDVDLDNEDKNNENITPIMKRKLGSRRKIDTEKQKRRRIEGKVQDVLGVISNSRANLLDQRNNMCENVDGKCKDSKFWMLQRAMPESQVIDNTKKKYRNNSILNYLVPKSTKSNDAEETISENVDNCIMKCVELPGEVSVLSNCNTSQGDNTVCKDVMREEAHNSDENKKRYLKEKRERALEQLRINARKKRAEKAKSRKSVPVRVKPLQEAKQEAIALATSQLEVIRNFQSTLLGKFKLSKQVSKMSLRNNSQCSLSQEVFTDDKLANSSYCDDFAETANVHGKEENSDTKEIISNDNLECLPIEYFKGQSILPTTDKNKLREDVTDEKETILADFENIQDSQSNSLKNDSDNCKKQSETNYLIGKYYVHVADISSEAEAISEEETFQQTMISVLVQCNRIVNRLESTFDGMKDIAIGSNTASNAMPSLYSAFALDDYQTPVKDCNDTIDPLESLFDQTPRTIQEGMTLTPNDSSNIFKNRSFTSRFQTPRFETPITNFHDLTFEGELSTGVMDTFFLRNSPKPLCQRLSFSSEENFLWNSK